MEYTRSEIKAKNLEEAIMYGVAGASGGQATQRIFDIIENFVSYKFQEAYERCAHDRVSMLVLERLYRDIVSKENDFGWLRKGLVRESK